MKRFKGREPPPAPRGQTEFLFTHNPRRKVVEMRMEMKSGIMITRPRSRRLSPISPASAAGVDLGVGVERAHSLGPRRPRPLA